MRIEMLNAGDTVLSVNPDGFVVKRYCGETDFIPFEKDAYGRIIGIMEKEIVTIGYKEETDGSESSVTIIEF